VGDFVTDTHGLIWYLEDSSRLGRRASAAFDACDQGECIIYVPVICLVEIIYLQEKGKIPSHLVQDLQEALRSGETGLEPISLTNEIANMIPNIPRTVVPDMPDRIIAATALYLGAPLLTKDNQIQKLGLPVVW